MSADIIIEDQMPTEEYADLSPDNLIPELRQIGDVVNGLLCVDWNNAHEFDQDDLTDYEYQLLHRYTFVDGNEANHSSYPHNAWISTDKVPVYFEPDGRFHLKLPLFLQPYRFEYKLKVIIWSTVEDVDADGNGNDDNAEIKWKATGEVVSEIVVTEVPSMLVDHKKGYKTGDVVSWFEPTTATFSDGVVTAVDEDMLTVQDDINLSNYSLEPDDTENIVVIPTSKVVLEEVPNENIIDVTSRGAAELALILRTDDQESHNVYYALREVSRRFIRDFLIPDLMDSIIDYEPFRDEIVYSSLLSMNVHQFLYSPDYRLRFGCCIGQSNLHLHRQWTFALSQAKMFKNPNEDGSDDSGAPDNDHSAMSLLDVERRINAVCYHCDLCRMEIHQFEHSFHCECNVEEGAEHDFCVSCTHSIYAQHNEMKPFLAKILMAELNDNCIEEIVAFCIGKVNRYDSGTNESELESKGKMSSNEAKSEVVGLEEKMSELRVS